VAWKLSSWFMHFVPDTLLVERTPPSCAAIEEHCQLLNVTSCMLSCGHFKLLVLSVYRSPSISKAECFVELHDLFTQLLQLTTFVTIVGDFNYHDHSDYMHEYIIRLSVCSAYLQSYLCFWYFSYLNRPCYVNIQPCGTTLFSGSGSQ